jgi:nucleotidyltransferase/DNA polymerase involved in DNA repair
MVEISRGIRDRLVELAVLDRRQHNNERTAEQIEAETIKEASREQRALESMVNTIANKCRTSDRDFLQSELQQATASKHRLLVDFDIALDEALRRRLIIHGSEVRRYQSARNLGT